MLIKENNFVINLDKVTDFYIKKYDYLNEYVIIFNYNNKEGYEIGNYKTYEEALKVFNEIIAYYNEGRKVYVIE